MSCFDDGGRVQQAAEEGAHHHHARCCSHFGFGVGVGTAGSSRSVARFAGLPEVLVLW